MVVKQSQKLWGSFNRHHTPQRGGKATLWRLFRWDRSWAFNPDQREEGGETPTWLVAQLLEKSHFDNNKFKAHGVFTEDCWSLVSPTRENPAATTHGHLNFLSPALAGTGQQRELTKRQSVWPSECPPSSFTGIIQLDHLGKLSCRISLIPSSYVF